MRLPPRIPVLSGRPACFLSYHSSRLSLWLFFFENKKQKMKATTVLLARANQLIAFRHGRLNAGAGVIPLYDSDLGANRAPARPAPRARARRTMRPVAA